MSDPGKTALTCPVCRTALAPGAPEEPGVARGTPTACDGCGWVDGLECELAQWYDATLHLGVRAIKAGDAGLATRQALRAITLFPDRPQARILLARAAVRQGDLCTARDQMRSAVELLGGALPAVRERAMTWLARLDARQGAIDLAADWVSRFNAALVGAKAGRAQESLLALSRLDESIAQAIATPASGAPAPRSLHRDHTHAHTCAVAQRLGARIQVLRARILVRLGDLVTARRCLERIADASGPEGCRAFAEQARWMKLRLSLAPAYWWQRLCACMPGGSLSGEPH